MLSSSCWVSKTREGAISCGNLPCDTNFCIETAQCCCRVITVIFDVTLLLLAGLLLVWQHGWHSLLFHAQRARLCGRGRHWRDVKRLRLKLVIDLVSSDKRPDEHVFPHALKSSVPKWSRSYVQCMYRPHKSKRFEHRLTENVAWRLGCACRWRLRFLSGYQITLQRKNYPTWFGEDISTIQVDVEFQENHRLRVQVNW